MKIGAVMFFTTDSMQPAPLARALEERGFESLWVPEHTHIPSTRKTPYPAGGPLIRPYYDIMDPFLVLNTAATVTTKLKVGTGIALLTQRDPIVTAKVVSSIDQLSNGRFLFGVGNGWNQDEIENHGTAFASRHKLARERMEAMKTIWTEEEPEYHGEFVNFDKMKQWPKPFQKPHPPIIVGGAFPYAARRAIRYGDGWIPRADRLEKDGVGVVIDKFRDHGQGSGPRSGQPAHHHLPRAGQDRRPALLPGDRRRSRHLHPAGREGRQADADHRPLDRAQAAFGRLRDGEVRHVAQLPDPSRAGRALGHVLSRGPGACERSQSAGLRLDLGQRAPRRGRRLLPLARRRLCGPGRRRSQLPHRPGCGAGAALWPSLAIGRGSVGDRQHVRRPHRDRPGTGLSAGRIRELRLELQDAHEGVRGVARHPGSRLARRTFRLRGPRLQREGRIAAPAAGQARTVAALGRRRGAEGAGTRGSLSRRLDRGAADRAAAPASARSSRSTTRRNGRAPAPCRMR